VLLDHNDVDALGVLEGEEAETTRTSSSGVAHNGALANLAEL
jgi:hypothetical protein